MFSGCTSLKELVDISKWNTVKVRNLARMFNFCSIGRDMEPEQMPVSVRFVAIEVEDLQTMHEGLTEKVEASKDKAVDAVKYLIEEIQKSN